jgi:hypothetical protein
MVLQYFFTQLVCHSLQMSTKINKNESVEGQVILDHNLYLNNIFKEMIGLKEVVSI